MDSMHPVWKGVKKNLGSHLHSPSCLGGYRWRSAFLGWGYGFAFIPATKEIFFSCPSGCMGGDGGGGKPSGWGWGDNFVSHCFSPSTKVLKLEVTNELLSCGQ